MSRAVQRFKLASQQRFCGFRANGLPWKVRLYRGGGLTGQPFVFSHFGALLACQWAVYSEPNAQTWMQKPTRRTAGLSLALTL